MGVAAVNNIATGETEYLDLSTVQGRARLDQIILGNIAHNAAEAAKGTDEALKRQTRKALARVSYLDQTGNT